MLLTLLHNLEQTPLSRWISESYWGFPTIETLHVLAIVLVAGTVAIVDFRLLGATSRDKSVIDVANSALPWTWGAFAVAALTGALMISSKGTHYINDLPFRLKFFVMALAGLNMVFFHYRTFRNVQAWDRGVSTPSGAKVAATLSLVLWACVIVLGRWIGFSA
jgi:uncharacterized membrane protein